MTEKKEATYISSEGFQATPEGYVDPFNLIDLDHAVFVLGGVRYRLQRLPTKAEREEAARPGE